ncbi:excinuclease ABC subunit UvrC [Columbia Basin potato purple top phytoplasma]|uniref:UvrABC system protein C n=1 Tax=Columbia Basin potato purple top phytoplasma TaxID=307134 RepID=A0ABT5L846_9MOLU|nr:excinuclease ABC subunit UvrC [Columbia Basin potato purple top phytoplasma]MDC9031850.1 excinuclease ABC subunit UvrC [Columbia Basin potato purple top phytoplasma]
MCLSKQLKTFPDMPGCYLFKDKNQNIIYIGKAKNLKNRIKSYYQGSHNRKTNLLISETTNVNYILTNNELEALILESNLIKKYTPKYNFKLIDDTSYPYIEITNEKHPRLISVRYKNVPPNKKIFGPFPNNEILKETISILYKIYPLRRCHPIDKKACVYYHIQQCLGPCHNPQVDYKKNIDAITKFLKGNSKEIITKIKKSMQQASKALEFEKALEYKKILFSLTKITEKQFINNIIKNKSCDIIASYFNQNEISLCILRLNKGNIFDHHQIILSYVGDAENNIITYLNLYYQEQIIPEEIILGSELNKEKSKIQKLLKTKITIPLKKNNKFHLYQLSLKNAKQNLLKNNLIHKSKFQIMQDHIYELSTFLNKNINHIEIFDNSHLFEQSFVSAMVVFKNFQFDKKSYRKFHIEKEFQNDYSSFEYVLQKRYKKLLNIKAPLPDLILIDGGQGQFNVCFQTLKDMNLNILLGALKKNKKHQLEALITEKGIFYLNSENKIFRFLLQLSAEVHRFVLNFHKKTKQKNIKNFLSYVPQIGIKQYQKLLENFKDIEEIKKAPYEEFQKLNIPYNVFIKLKKNI